jgi:hypothetical protein
MRLGVCHSTVLRSAEASAPPQPQEGRAVRRGRRR